MGLLSRLSEEKLNALEKILSANQRRIKLKDIVKVINAYDTYNQNATLAAKELSYNTTTILKYWRRAGFSIRNKGVRGPHKGLYEKYKSLINRKLHQSEISRELKVNIGAVNNYLTRHPELMELYRKKRNIKLVWKRVKVKV